MDAKRSKLYASYFLISLNETTSQLQKSMKLLEKTNLKGLEDKVCGSLQIASIRIPLSELL